MDKMNMTLTSDQLDEVAGLLRVLNGPLLDEVCFAEPVKIADINGDCLGYILSDEDNAYVFYYAPE